MRRLFLIAIVCLSVIGCSTPINNRTPLNESFPNVVGENLNEQSILLPAALEGDLNLLLIGFVQDAQFDIDRWLIGLDFTKTPIKAYEIPTIQGMLPRMFESVINEGMRKGIPKSLWGGVITVYDDAQQLASLTGTQFPNNARVLLLDEQGTIRYFYDEGFAVEALNNLRSEIEKLRQ
ncbi:hypothetical protein HII17_00090 [Thalassotalea sp. M1531]|uniref:Lipoprotein n=1 Tax=Thalassotalea algicola TaxID=2716224 RepID=A0A7Y0Q555_9GAMM|nr:hypothetical protein [Thalassotalea algicola]NMP29943.1 hypothetical protein [Thalassotalea algicola]